MSPREKYVPRGCNISLVLRSFTDPPYDLLGTSSGKCPAQKMLFLMGLPSGKRIRELHGISYCTPLTKEWKSIPCFLATDFIMKTQESSVPDSRFESFFLSVLTWEDANPDGKLLCLVCSQGLF